MNALPNWSTLSGRYEMRRSLITSYGKLCYPQSDFDDSIYETDRKIDHTSIEKLATCNWIDKRRNLFITEMISSSKTYLNNTLCVSMRRKPKIVRYIKTSHLMLELE